MKRYDVVIVGAGSAGIFTALELTSKGKNLEILLLDKGKDIAERECPLKFKKASCKSCLSCALLSGWGRVWR